MTSVPLPNHTQESAESRDLVGPLGAQGSIDDPFDDIWRDSWSEDEENESGKGGKKKQLRAVSFKVARVRGNFVE